MDIGAQLRAAREAQGLSLTNLSRRTRVPEKALAAIERNDTSALPPPPFSRGFVRTYAQELDLDPNLLVRDYFAQFPELPPATAPPKTEIVDASWQPQPRWIGLGTAFAILVVVVAAAVVLGRRSENSTGPEPVGTSGETPRAPTTAATPTEVKTAGTPERSDAVQPGAAAAPAVASQPSGRLNVVLSTSRPCWVTATVDGRRTIYRILQAGERETLAGDHDVSIRFGDAGAVSWTINGRNPGPPGENGAVRDVRVTPQNAATVQ